MKETADQGIELDGVSIAPGVVETIISLAAAEVPGVSGVGTAGAISAMCRRLQRRQGNSHDGHQARQGRRRQAVRRDAPSKRITGIA